MTQKQTGIRSRTTAAGLAALMLFSVLFSTPAAAAGSSVPVSGRTYDAAAFELPAGAKTLVVAEGFAVNGGKSTYDEGYVADTSRYNKVRVTAYTRADDTEAWTAKAETEGVMGWNGMSSQRTVGNGETPIGLFRLNTPFGRRPAADGFPSDYREVMIAEHSLYWSDITNRLEQNPDISAQSGELVWEDWAAGIYSYVLDFGFNRDNANGNGSALFLHCTKPGKPSTAGCIAIDTEAMEAILRMYAQGDAYIAIAPAGQFENVYHAYNETGKSPDGTFTGSDLQLPDMQTRIAE
jgi:L,D-peptidoglycan transpeptidase YkuD (ErfK/YbiS/YcfS/YnhG family)